MCFFPKETNPVTSFKVAQNSLLSLHSCSYRSPTIILLIWGAITRLSSTGRIWIWHFWAHGMWSNPTFCFFCSMSLVWGEYFRIIASCRRPRTHLWKRKHLQTWRLLVPGYSIPFISQASCRGHYITNFKTQYTIFLEIAKFPKLSATFEHQVGGFPK